MVSSSPGLGLKLKKTLKPPETTTITLDVLREICSKCWKLNSKKLDSYITISTPPTKNNTTWISYIKPKHQTNSSHPFFIIFPSKCFHYRLPKVLWSNTGQRSFTLEIYHLTFRTTFCFDGSSKVLKLVLAWTWKRIEADPIPNMLHLWMIPPWIYQWIHL